MKEQRLKRKLNYQQMHLVNLYILKDLNKSFSKIIIHSNSNLSQIIFKKKIKLNLMKVKNNFSKRYIFHGAKETQVKPKFSILFKIRIN